MGGCEWQPRPGPGLWSLVLGPFGPDLGPDLDLTWDLDLSLTTLSKKGVKSLSDSVIFFCFYLTTQDSDSESKSLTVHKPDHLLSQG